jgi:hypothetical protein
VSGFKIYRERERERKREKRHVHGILSRLSVRCSFCSAVNFDLKLVFGKRHGLRCGGPLFLLLRFCRE